jgi:3-hydroxybutyryl-CoA dehydrogenase
MGSGVAAVFLAGGWDVDLVTPSPATRASLEGRVRAAFARMPGRHFDPARLRAHAELAEVPWADVALAVENAPEDLALKQGVFRELERLAPPGIPLASNASSLPISRIGEGLATQRRMLGLHFYMPAYLVPLVEVVRSERTDPAVAAQACEWMWALGKRPVQVARDIEGFLANRIQHALIREAVHLLDSGIASAEDIDAAVRYSFGFRLAVAGPLLQREHAGWDMSCSVARALYPHLCNIDAPPKVVEDLVRQGRHGMKAGRGLYEWDRDSMATEKRRYEAALQEVLAVIQREGLR